MEAFLDIIKIVIPGVLVLLTAMYFLKKNTETKHIEKSLEIKAQQVKTIVPLRLQAYERVVLLLERIHPESLIIRVSAPNMSADQLKQMLLLSIREEFEHNLSQQVYISPEAWEAVKQSRENVVSLINISYSKLEIQPVNGIELSKMIYGILGQTPSPTKTALDLVKKEIYTLF